MIETGMSNAEKKKWRHIQITPHLDAFNDAERIAMKALAHEKASPINFVFVPK